MVSPFKLAEKILEQMHDAPQMFASNKESFAFQILMIFSMCNIKLRFEQKDIFYNIAGMKYGNSIINTNDSFEDGWAKTLVEHSGKLLREYDW